MEHAKWLEERRKGIGGSDIAAIMGLSPWKTAFRVYQEKRGEIQDWSGNESTDWGQRLEPMIRQWYSDRTGRPVRVPEKILVSEKHPFLFASLDGFTDDKRIVEIKTARSGKGWGEPGTDEIPPYYTLQVQHYMIVTGFEVSDIPVSISGAPPELYEVPADRELQEMIVEAAVAFWKQVEAGIPPEPTCYADAIARFGKSKAEGVIIASEDIVNDIVRLKGIKAMQEDLKTQEEELKGRVIMALGENGNVLSDPEGNVLVTWKMSKGRTYFDTKAFQEEHPKLYEQYLRNGEGSRRFLIK